MTALGDDTSDHHVAARGDSAQATVTALPGLTAGPRGALPDRRQEAADRHPSALGRRLDGYLAAVARELRDQGVRTGEPQRIDPAGLNGTIALDCTALRVAATEAGCSPNSTDRPGRRTVSREQAPDPVDVVWDEQTGWCVGLRADGTGVSRRYLQLELLPPPAVVADFVVGLAIGRPVGTTRPADGRPPLHVHGRTVASRRTNAP